MLPNYQDAQPEFFLLCSEPQLRRSVHLDVLLPRQADMPRGGFVDSVPLPCGNAQWLLLNFRVRFPVDLAGIRSDRCRARGRAHAAAVARRRRSFVAVTGEHPSSPRPQALPEPPLLILAECLRRARRRQPVARPSQRKTCQRILCIPATPSLARWSPSYI